MPKNIISGGADFDDLFDPDIIGDGPSAAFLTSGGVPLKYVKLAYGTKRADVGFRDAAGVDVSNYWAAKGSSTYVSGDAVPGTLIDYQVNSSGPVTSTASFTYLRNGTTTYFPATITSDTWKTPTGATVGDDYDIRFTQISGNASGTLTATLNTWMQINTGRNVTLSVTRSTSGSITSHRTILIEIRRRSDGLVLSSESVYMEAQADIS